MGHNQTTISEYILLRLKELGVDHLFGVPGDFVIPFLEKVVKSPVKFVGTCNELNAAYAADGYGRLRGIGALTTTYAVGELSALNGVAGAYAERVSVVHIVGSPSTSAVHAHAPLHHTLGNYGIPQEIYEKVTVASVYLDNPKTAPQKIDCALQKCVLEQKPVYLRLPADMVEAKCEAPKEKLNVSLEEYFETDQNALKEAVNEACQMLEGSQNPVILAGIELERYRATNEFKSLVSKTGYPFATMLLGKCVIDEEGHSQFIGLYEGARSVQSVQERVENASCVLELGILMTDFNTGGFTANIKTDREIRANIYQVRIKHHVYHNIYLKDFVRALTERLSHKKLDIKPASASSYHKRCEMKVEPGKKITHHRLWDQLANFLPENAIVIAETGDALFSAAETIMPKGTTFISQTFYGSIGYTLGAALGAATACPERKVILFIGDGSLQMTCQDISTMIRCSLNNVRIFVINNDGYTIERAIIDNSYNDIQPWKYFQLPKVFAGEKGFDVRKEGELEEALRCLQTQKKLGFVEVHLDRMDCCPTMKQAGKQMRSHEE